jgi:hypothetical protein
MELGSVFQQVYATALVVLILGVTEALQDTAQLEAMSALELVSQFYVLMEMCAQVKSAHQVVLLASIVQTQGIPDLLVTITHVVQEYLIQMRICA